MKKSLKKLKGFTLVELLIVIAIIAVLAVVITPNAINAVNESKATAVLADIKSIQTAELTTYVQTNAWPANIDAMDLTGLGKTNATYTYAATGDARVITVTGLSAKVAGILTTKLGTTVFDGLTITITPAS